MRPTPQFSHSLGCLILVDPRDKHAWAFASPAEEAKSCRFVIATSRLALARWPTDLRWHLAQARTAARLGLMRRCMEEIEDAKWCRLKFRAARLDLARALRRLAELEPPPVAQAMARAA